MSNCALGRFAVADGASESVFAGEWARLLCESFVAEPVDPAKLAEWRSALQPRWLTSVRTETMPWYLEEKLQEGAFATFLGIVLGDAGGKAGRSWQSLAVGDSCLFHIRADILLAAVPVDRADEFGTRPPLIGSRQRSAAVPVMARGILEPGDYLLLMTDALAEWFLVDFEAGGAPWSELVRLREDDFTEWVGALRETSAIKNDDVTLLIVEIDSPRPTRE